MTGTLFRQIDLYRAMATVGRHERSANSEEAERTERSLRSTVFKHQARKMRIFKTPCILPLRFAAAMSWLCLDLRLGQEREEKEMNRREGRRGEANMRDVGKGKANRREAGKGPGQKTDMANQAGAATRELGLTCAWLVCERLLVFCRGVRVRCRRHVPAGRALGRREHCLLRARLRILRLQRSHANTPQ